MLTSDFDYNLPKELIAQVPVEPRDSSRLMVIDKKKKRFQHRHFFDLSEFLRAGDLLVWNNTKVFKARLRGVVELDEKISDFKKDSTDLVFNSPRIEVFLLRPMENFGVWRALAKPGRKLRLGMRLRFAQDFYCQVLGKELDGTILVQFTDDENIVRQKANQWGEVPTPPYISPQGQDDSKENKNDLAEKYQTVYAKVEGSVAAPTAGFHFTPQLIEKIKEMGVEFAEVTLHVGLGTFQPVKTKKIEEHKMHAEWVEITDANVKKINQAKEEGRRVVAVGTTTARTLEGVVGSQTLAASLKSYSGEVDIFITPGFEFKIVDVLITNFHLPKSTLLMLVAAFVKDKEFVLKCYQEAVKEKYRFYSFGDAMLIY